MIPKSTYVANRIRLSTDFDNGALVKVVENETNVLDCWPYVDEEYVDGSIELRRSDGKNAARDGATFCFLFRLDGCQDQRITLRFHIVYERSKEGDTSIVYANPDFPVFSYDGNEWQRTIDKELTGAAGLSDEKIVTVRETFRQDTVWVAYQYPYTNSHLSELIKRIKGSPFCTVQVAGQSTEGRQINQITVTDPTWTLDNGLYLTRQVRNSRHLNKGRFS